MKSIQSLANLPTLINSLLNLSSMSIYISLTLIDHIRYLTNLAMNWYSWLSKTSLDPSLVYEYGLTFVCNELQKEDVAYFNHELLQRLGISIAKHRLEILKLARTEIGAPRPQGFSRFVSAMNKTKRCLTKCIRRLVFHEASSAFPADNPVSSPYQVEWREKSLSNHQSSKEHNKDERLMLTCRSEPNKEERLLFTKRSPKVVANGHVDGRVKERFVVAKERKKVQSGPLDKRVQEKFMVSTKGPKVVSGPLDARFMFTCGGPNSSGPHDGKRQEKILFPNRSPRVMSGPLEGSMQQRLMYTNRSPWVSGPLDGRASPSVYGVYNKENGDGDDGLQSIWATMFQDMKPT